MSQNELVPLVFPGSAQNIWTVTSSFGSWSTLTWNHERMPFSLSYEDLNLVWIIFLLLVKGVFNSLFTMDRTVCKHGVYYVFNHKYHQFPQSKSNFIGCFTYNMIFRFISASPCKKLKYWTISQITTDYIVNVLFETRQWIYMRNTYQSVEQLIQ